MLVELRKGERGVTTPAIAGRLGFLSNTVKRIRAEARRRGCLPPFACACGTPTPKGGRCLPCEERVNRNQVNARDRAKWNPRLSVTRAWRLPPIGAAYVEAA